MSRRHHGPSSSKAAPARALRTIRSACLCAGTGCTEWVLSSIVRAIRRRLRTAGLSHETLFFCEKSHGKRNFIRVNHGPDALVFWDVHEMAHDQARQGRGGGSLKRVPLHVDFVFSGPSCRDLSVLNNGRASLGHVVEERSGSSGATFGATMEYIKRSSAKLVVLEQVKGLWLRRGGERVSGNRQAWEETLSDASLEFLVVPWTSSDYFLPQTRERVYTLAASPRHCGLGAQDVRARLQRAQAIVSLLSSAEARPDLRSFLLPESHPAMGAARLQLVARASKFSDLRRKDVSGRVPKWVSQHRRIFEECSVEWVEPVLHDTEHGPCGYSAMEEDNVFYQSLTDRQKHVLVLLSWRYGERTGVPWDLHDSLERLVPRIDAQLPSSLRTVTPGAKLWCAFLRPQRFLIGAELMAMQGMFPEMYAGGFADSLLSSLAGNAFSTTVVAAIVLALLAEFGDVLTEQ